MKIANPGKITSHQAWKASLPELSKEPHVTTSGGTPTPKKERLDSIRMAAATPKAIATNAGATPFGKACLKMILASLKPSD
jgi:hypothetical protein